MKRQFKTYVSDSAGCHRRPSRRRGAVAMILVMAVTIIGTILLTQGIRSVLNERGAMPAVFEQQQTQMLLKAGLQKLNAAPSIDDIQSGEWMFVKGTLHAEQTGQLKVTKLKGVVTIVAKYPLESDTPVRLSATLMKSDWGDL